MIDTSIPTIFDFTSYYWIHERHQENLTGWHLRQIVGTLNTEVHRRYKGKELSLIDTRILIGKKVQAVLDGKEKRVLIIMPPPGSGKTRICIEAINKRLTCQRKTAAWFGTQHSQFEEFENLRKGWVHVKGRTLLDDSGNARIGNCGKADEALEAARQGLSVVETVCKGCNRYTRCTYYEQFKLKRHKFYPHQHIFTPYWKDADVVVIDEFDPKVFLEEMTLTSDDLKETTRVLGTDLFKAMDLMLHDNEELSGRRFYDALESKLRSLGHSPSNVKALREVVGELLSGMRRSGTSSGSNKNGFPIPLYRRAIELMELEIGKWEKGQDFNGQISLNPKPFEGKPGVFIVRKKELPDALLKKPIVVLTATGDVDLIRKLLKVGSSDIEILRPRINLPAKVKIIQVTGCTNGIRSMSEQSTRRRIVNDARKHIQVSNDKRTALITFKEYENALATKLGLKVSTKSSDKSVNWADTGHFYGIKGTNVFEHYDNLIIAGTPTPNIESMVRQVRAFYCDESPLDEKPKTETRDYKQASQTGEPVRVDVVGYADERIDGYLQSLREDEIVQSLYRIRPLSPNGRKAITVVLLTQQPIQGLEVKVVESEKWHQTWSEDHYKRIRSAAGELLKNKGQFEERELVEASPVKKSTVNKYMGELIQDMRLKKKTESIKKKCKDGRTRTFSVNIYTT